MFLASLRRRRRLAAILIALAAITCMFTASTSAAKATATAVKTATKTTVGASAAKRQLTWLIGASARAPLPASEIEQHLTAQYLTALGGPAEVNAALSELGTLTLHQVTYATSDLVHADVASALGDIEVELQTATSGQIMIVEFLGILQAPVPTSWRALDAGVRALAPQVSFAAMTIGTNGCHLINGVNPATARPLGSSFKFYVLGALGQAIEDHKASWNENLAIHEQWKSLPSGILQNLPAGTKLTLRDFADYMISESDNTAADHLIHFVGRDAVQDQLVRFGNASPDRDIPFITTRELFVLRSVDYPKLADNYLADSRAQRIADLAKLDKIPLSEVHSWTNPEMIDQIEWYASPADICRAYQGLWRENAEPGMSPVGGALSINDGGIGLNREQYPIVWFKGGSEPGVLTLNYLVRTVHGQLIVSSLMLADPDSPFGNSVTEEALALVRGGIQLAAK
jgi:beta-lactamase class A